MKVLANKLKITEIFEVRIRMEQMKEIVSLSKKHKITFSWVTRICLFKLLEQYTHLSLSIHLTNAEEKEDLLEVKEKKLKLHRHQLCLYGKDAIRVRFLASELGFTITQLVRIALRLFIHILSEKIEKKLLVEIGIKIVASVMEKLNNYTKIPFEVEDYWPFRPCAVGKVLIKFRR